VGNPYVFQDRWARLKEFIACWHRPLTVGDGIPLAELNKAESRLVLRLPSALREWYLLAGKREELNTIQDRLLPPSELEIVDDHLIFYIENQSVVLWGIPLGDLELPDPSVQLDIESIIERPDDNGDYSPFQHYWIQENKTLSEFMLEMVIHQTLFTGVFSGNAPIDSITMRRVEMAFPDLGLPAWHWPAYPTRFFGNDEILLVTDGDTWLWVTARSYTALTNVAEQLDVQWEYLYDPLV